MRSIHLSRCPTPHARARAAHEPPGHMAAQLKVTVCDLPCPGSRAPHRRYLQPGFGCLRCNRGGSWASARTHYLQWCPRCSRCNSRRCLMSRSRSVAGPASPAEGVPSSLASSLPAPDCCGQERSRPAGRLSVLGDGQGSDRPDPRWAGAPALARGVVAATAASPASRRHRGTQPAVRYRLRRDHPPAAGDRSAASAPARSACGGRTSPKTRPQTAMTPVMTCPRSCGGDMSTPQKRSPTRHYL